LLLLLGVVLSSKCPGPKCPYAGLSADDRASYQTTNRHHVEHLDQYPRHCIDKFLEALDQHDTVIKLGHAIKGGHSIMYEMVEGKDFSIVKKLAAKHHIQVAPSRQCKCTNCCGRLIVPGKSVKIVEAVDVPGKRQLRANMPKSGEKPYKKQPNEFRKLKDLKAVNNPHKMLTQQLKDKKATKCCLPPEKVQNYYDNNVHHATLMHFEARPLVEKFLKDLKQHSPKTVIHMLAPPKDGKLIRFTMVQGSIAAVKKYAVTCGLILRGDTLYVKGAHPKSAEHTLETDKDNHIEVGRREQSDAGVPKPVQVAAKRDIVKELPKKWITNTKFLEVEADDNDAFLATLAADDNDAFIEKPNHADDDDSFLAA
jgi:hypothetical protein